MKPNEISLEQVRQVLHVSKRKAAWMLQNGVIPCRIRPCKTHRYIVRVEDLDEYLRRAEADRAREIPVGLFNSQTQKRPEWSWTIQGEERERFADYLECRLQRASDRLSLRDVVEITGYDPATVCGWVKDGLLYAVRVGRWLCVPKSGLIGFLASEHALRILPRSGWHRKMLRGFLKEEKVRENDQKQSKA